MPRRLIFAAFCWPRALRADRGRLEARLVATSSISDGRPDPARWTYETGFVRNQELQWYRPENAWCENGMLIIEGRRERVKNPAYEAGSANWKRAREFAEYHLRQPHHQGHPELALRPLRNARPHRYPRRTLARLLDRSASNGPWPRNGEIDIMEYYRGKLLANLIWQGPERTSSFTRRKPDRRLRRSGVVQQVPRLAHGLGREPHRDHRGWRGAQRFRPEPRRQSRRHQRLPPAALHHSEPRDRRHRGRRSAETKFPARFEIDWVRVYQKQ